MRCKVCHRLLTDPVSRSAGIGPVCRERVNVQTALKRQGQPMQLRAVHAKSRQRWLASRFQIELEFEELTDG